MATAAQKMVKARANLVMGNPFFGTLALRLKMVEDTSVKSASTDGSVLKYNPEYVSDLSLTKVQGMIAHTVMHPAFLHHTRRGDRDIKKWNKACDYSINTILEKAGFDLPEATFVDSAYDGLVAEHIYTLLPEEEEGGDGGGSGGGGDGGGQDNDPGGDGGVEDSPESQNNGGSQSQQNNEEAEWKVALAQAAHVAKQTGHLPAGMDRFIEELLAPVLPWKDILRRFMTEKSNDDFSWARGNRRFVAQGLYLPSRISEDAMGAMVVCIDTSGSIQQNELDIFAAEIRDIVAEARPEKTIVIYCDSRIAHIDEFAPDDEIEFKIHGGGGTDFRPPFEWLEENQISPKALVYMTDGYGPFPEEQDFPVMWCINNHNVTPPNGEHLVLEAR